MGFKSSKKSNRTGINASTISGKTEYYSAKAAGSQYVNIGATGGTKSIIPDGSGGVYTLHTFTSPGQSFTVTSGSGDIRYLVVAGGGGGGGRYMGGGGGAGGFLTGTTPITVGQSFVITVGTGGAGGNGGSTQGSDGGDSSIGSLVVATGGGGGGSDTPPTYSGRPGGSGGGSSGYATTSPYRGAGTAGQGNRGGNGNAYGAVYDDKEFG